MKIRRLGAHILGCASLHASDKLVLLYVLLRLRKHKAYVAISMSRLARNTGLTVPTVHAAAARLLDLGILKQTQAGRVRRFTLHAEALPGWNADAAPQFPFSPMGTAPSPELFTPQAPTLSEDEKADFARVVQDVIEAVREPVPKKKKRPKQRRG